MHATGRDRPFQRLWILCGLCLALGLSADTPSSFAAAANRQLSPPAAPTAKAAEPKDFWDKLEAVSGIISGLAVALIGFYATNLYNKRQKEAEQRDAKAQQKAEEDRKDKELNVNQIQTFASFIPYLSGQNEEAKRAALVLISSLGNPELAVELSRIFTGPGATRALTDIASESGAPGSAFASRSLLEVLAPLQLRVASLFGGGGLRATAFVVSRDWLATPAHALFGDPSEPLEVQFDGPRVPASVVYKDNVRDLAILAVDRPLDLRPIDRAKDPPQIGDRVAALQIRPDDGTRMIDFGRVTAVDVRRPGTPTRFLETDLTGFPGAGGSPVVNNAGQLLGVMHSVDEEGRQYLISADDVFAFKDETENRVGRSPAN